MHKPDSALNNLQWLICHQIKPNLIQYYCAQKFFRNKYQKSIYKRIMNAIPCLLA